MFIFSWPLYFFSIFTLFCFPEQWARVTWSDGSRFHALEHAWEDQSHLPTSGRYRQSHQCNTIFLRIVAALQLPKNAIKNGNSYIEVSNDLFLQVVQIHNSSIFMHDSAPCYHKVQMVISFIFLIISITGCSGKWMLRPEFFWNCCHIMKNLLVNSFVLRNIRWKAPKCEVSQDGFIILPKFQW